MEEINKTNSNSIISTKKTDQITNQPTNQPTKVKANALETRMKEKGKPRAGMDRREIYKLDGHFEKLELSDEIYPNNGAITTA